MSISTGVGSTPKLRDGALKRRAVPMPAYCKELWQFMCSEKEYSEVINMTHLVTAFRGEFDLGAWNRSIELLMTRHSVLAARVHNGLGGLEFLVDPDSRPGLKIVDVSSSCEADRKAAARTLADQLVWEPFDPNEGRLFRAFAILISPSETILGIVVHHFVADGWSMEVIGRDLLTAYVSMSSPRRLLLPEHYVEYLDYIQWMNGWLQGPEARSQADYWASKLAEPPDVCLPREHDVDLDAQVGMAIEPFTLDSALTQAIRRRAGKNHTTPFLILLTAMTAALSTIIGTRDVVITVNVDQRGSPGLRHTVGYLVNRLPVRTTISLNGSFDELVATVKESYLGAYRNQLHPYFGGELRRAYPWFRFRRLAPARMEPTSGDTGFSPFDLPERPILRTSARRGGAGYALDIEDRGVSMRGRVHYLPNVYAQATAARLVQTFLAAAEIAAGESGKSVAQLLQRVT